MSNLFYIILYWWAIYFGTNLDGVINHSLDLFSVGWLCSISCEYSLKKTSP